MANADGSNTLSWTTTGAATGDIQYTKQDGTAATIDISPSVNSGSMVLAAADTAIVSPAPDSKQYYTITIYDAAGANNSKTTYAQ